MPPRERGRQSLAALSAWTTAQVRVSRKSTPDEPVRATAVGQIGGTLSAQVIALLKQPAGCRLQDLMKATGWQARSVRGFLSGHLHKKLGLRVKSFRRDGERVYALRN